MNQTNHDIFAEQYKEEYAKLCKSNPWWSIPTRMRIANENTKEYLYLKLKEELDIDIVWPSYFKTERSEDVRPEGGPHKT